MTSPTFGVLHDFRQPLPWRVPAAQYYRECLDLIAESERLGFDTAWICEHHGTPDGFVPSPLVAAAAVTARTTHLRVGTNVVLLPMHHPLRVAEDAATVATLSNGRLVLGVGLGYSPHEFALAGVDPRHRPSRFEEGLAILRRAFEEGRTGFEGRRFTLPDGPFEPRPADPVPIYIGAVTPQAVDRAIRLGDGYIVYVSRVDDVRERHRLMTEALARHGRDRTDFRFAVTTICHVAPDADRAWAEAGPAIADLETAFRSMGAEGTVSVDDLRREEFLVGTPDDVAARLAALHAETAYDHLAFWGRLPGLSLDRAAASQRLFADEVLPRFA